MSKSIDLDLLNARMRDQELLVSNAKYLEGLALQEDTPEEVVKRVKDFLNLGEDQSVLKDSTEVIKNYNLQTKAFLELVQFKYKAEKTGLIDPKEVLYITNIEKRIAKKISERFDVELDELYVEEE